LGLLVELEDLNHVRARDLSQRARLLQEPAPHLLVRGERSRHLLDGDAAAEHDVLAEVDGAHRPAPELSQEPDAPARADRVRAVGGGRRRRDPRR
jgi:hypothetical protein